MAAIAVIFTSFVAALIWRCVWLIGHTSQRVCGPSVAAMDSAVIAAILAACDGISPKQARKRLRRSAKLQERLDALGPDGVRNYYAQRAQEEQNHAARVERRATVAANKLQREQEAAERKAQAEAEAKEAAAATKRAKRARQRRRRRSGRRHRERPRHDPHWRVHDAWRFDQELRAALAAVAAAAEQEEERKNTKKKRMRERRPEKLARTTRRGRRRRRRRRRWKTTTTRRSRLCRNRATSRVPR